jgi:hypothetical protein
VQNDATTISQMTIYQTTSDQNLFRVGQGQGDQIFL